MCDNTCKPRLPKNITAMTATNVISSSPLSKVKAMANFGPTALGIAMDVQLLSIRNQHGGAEDTAAICVGGTGRKINPLYPTGTQGR